MSAKIYYESDCDPSALAGKTIAVIGYGSQGHAHALNNHDSGNTVVVGARPDSRAWNAATADGLRVATVADATAEADVVMLLVPDHIQAGVYRDQIEPNLKPGAMLMFAHGFNIRFGGITPRSDVDVAMIAPKGPGHLVRRQYVDGIGVPGLIAVEQDATGNAHALALAYGHAIGCARGGLIETTFTEETETDLFGEQAVLCGGASHLVQMGFETLVEAGYQPEIAYFECLHELKLIVDLMYEGGLAGMRYSISDTAEYGDLTRGPKVIDEHVRQNMQQVLKDVQQGVFAAEMMAEEANGRPNFKRMRQEAADTQLEQVGAQLRSMMPWIGESAAEAAAEAQSGMHRRILRLHPPAEPSPDPGFERIREQFEIPRQFPAEVQAAAEQAAARPVDGRRSRRPARDIEFFTRRPGREAVTSTRPCSSSVATAAIGCGTRSPTWRPSLIAAARSRRRPGAGARRCTAPTCRIPLYPTVLSEGAASLLPDVDRPAVVFTIDLDDDRHPDRRYRSSGRWCAAAASSTTRASAASRRRCCARSVSGGRRSRSPVAGCSCRCPSRRSCTIPRDPDAYRLELEQRAALRGLERADLTARRDRGRRRHAVPPGRAAADDGGRRRVPAGRASAKRRRASRHWPAAMSYGDFARSLDPAKPREAALLTEARGVMGHAGYTAFDGAAARPAPACRAGDDLRPLHRAHAPPGRPLRARPAGGAVRGRSAQRGGGRDADSAARRDGGERRAASDSSSGR